MASALRIATTVAVAVAGCARGGGTARTGTDAAAGDGPMRPDASPDGSTVLPADGAPDAGCTISSGVTPAIDGVHDLADYPAAQQVGLFATLDPSDGAAVAWDASFLYITVASSAFAAAYEPLHVYVETAAGELPAAAASQGKEYSGLVPALPFTATHLLAARQVDDAGSGPYDGVFVPDAGWTVQQTALVPGQNVFVSSDQHELSLKVPWGALGGCPTAMRLAFHVVHAMPANEWKDVAPTTSTPWQAPGGGYYEIDLTGPTAVASWTLR